MNHAAWLRILPWTALVAAVACSSATPTENVGGSGTNASSGSNGVGSGSAGGTSGDTSTGSASGAATNPGIGTSGSVTSGSTNPASGTASGSATTGSTSGAGGAGATSGTSSGIATGGSGSGGSAGAGSGSASSGAVTGTGRKGMSPGCGLAPMGAVEKSFTNHKLPIPKCTGCTAAMANCGRDCIAPEFAPGGVSDQEAGGESFINRDFSIELPANYQPSTAYPVYLGGGGCGGGPPQNGDGYGLGETNAIQIGLGYLVRCFADGGSACSGMISNEVLCKNGPEIPYVRAVLKWVESNFCVDLGREFIGGGSSGGWEAMTASCGDADEFRGFVSTSGGLRVNQWPCLGPMAGLMVTNTGDTANPVGPLAKIDADLDSFGSAPERDALLQRNGCIGTATAMYDPGFPACVKYTGCPAAFPVVWCELNGGHDNTQMGNLDYKNAMWPFLSSLPAEP
jgi:hypothetical protein